MNLSESARFFVGLGLFGLIIIAICVAIGAYAHHRDMKDKK